MERRAAQVFPELRDLPASQDPGVSLVSMVARDPSDLKE